MSAQSQRRGARFLLVPLVLAAGIGWWYLSVQHAAPPRDEVVRTVRVARPERTNMEERFSVRSFVEADQTVTVLPLVSGTIDQLIVDVGDPVRTGSVIAGIDPAQYELALAQAEASFTAAESTFLRTRRLYEANATPVQNYDHARAQYEAARSRRDLAQLRLGYTDVTSPVDGVVLVRHVARGDVASPERPIVTVGDITDLVVRAAVPEERYRSFANAPEAIGVRMAIAGEVYPGEIRTVGPYVSAETRTFEVLCTVGGDITAVRPGMSVTVAFVLDTREAVLTLPREAVGYGNTLWYVSDGRAWSMDAPDLFTDGDALQIEEADAERLFVVAGHHFLSDGQRVEVIGEAE